MSVPRQGESSDEPAGRRGVAMGSGRVAQKRRTRAALVEAAQELIAEGTPPTVALAAERAEVGRTTAYRYFPTQESLLVEVALGADVADLEELVASPLDGQTPAERTAEVLRGFTEHVAAEEVRYRTSQRLYHDMWLTAVAGGEDDPIVREGRRRRWIETMLADELAGLPAAEAERLVAALAMASGPEPMTALRDVARLSPDEAVEVSDWVVRTLLEATLGDAGRGRPQSGSGPPS